MMERDGVIIEENILPRRPRSGHPVGGLTFAQAKALADDVRGRRLHRELGRRAQLQRHSNGEGADYDCA